MNLNVRIRHLIVKGWQNSFVHTHLTKKQAKVLWVLRSGRSILLLPRTRDPKTPSTAHRALLAVPATTLHHQYTGCRLSLALPPPVGSPSSREPRVSQHLSPQPGALRVQLPLQQLTANPLPSGRCIVCGTSASCQVVGSLLIPTAGAGMLTQLLSHSLVWGHTLFAPAWGWVLVPALRLVGHKPLSLGKA